MKQIDSKYMFGVTSQNESIHLSASKGNHNKPDTLANNSSVQMNELLKAENDLLKQKIGKLEEKLSLSSRYKGGGSDGLQQELRKAQQTIQSMHEEQRVELKVFSDKIEELEAVVCIVLSS